MASKDPKKWPNDHRDAHVRAAKLGWGRRRRRTRASSERLFLSPGALDAHNRNDSIERRYRQALRIEAGWLPKPLRSPARKRRR